MSPDVPMYLICHIEAMGWTVCLPIHEWLQIVLVCVFMDPMAYGGFTGNRVWIPWMFIWVVLIVSDEHSWAAKIARNRNKVSVQHLYGYSTLPRGVWSLTVRPWKMDGWKTILSYWVSASFQGQTVKLREAKQNAEWGDLARPAAASYLPLGKAGRRHHYLAQTIGTCEKYRWRKLSLVRMVTRSLVGYGYSCKML